MELDERFCYVLKKNPLGCRRGWRLADSAMRIASLAPLTRMCLSGFPGFANSISKIPYPTLINPLQPETHSLDRKASSLSCLCPAAPLLPRKFAVSPFRAAIGPCTGLARQGTGKTRTSKAGPFRIAANFFPSSPNLSQVRRIYFRATSCTSSSSRTQQSLDFLLSTPFFSSFLADLSSA
jgi:hypothetical protein